MEVDRSWKEVEKSIHKNFKLKVNASARTLTIFTKHKMSKRMSKQDKSQNTLGLKQMMELLLGKSVDFTLEPLEAGDGIKLGFNDDDSLQQMHEFLKDLFFDPKLQRMKKLGGKMKESLEKKRALEKRVKGREKPKERPERKPEAL